MTTIISDGTGKGYRARVDVNNRIHALSVSSDVQGQSALEGNTYNVNSGTINLTSSSESAVLYFENTGEVDLHISSVGYLLGNSTGGSGDLEVRVLRNPTGGTIVSNAVDVDVNVNRNFGSSNELAALAYKGTEGDTITGGTEAYYTLLPKDATTYLISTGTLVLPRGKSIGIAITPQAGNTSMNAQFFLSVIEYNL
jgi:hypothetical protein